MRLYIDQILTSVSDGCHCDLIINRKKKINLLKLGKLMKNCEAYHGPPKGVWYTFKISILLGDLGKVNSRAEKNNTNN